MTRDEVKLALSDAWQAYQARVDEIADSVRSSDVVPLCREKGWGFSAGMGAWCIIIDGEVVHPSYDASHPEVNKLDGMLSIPIPGMNQDLGAFMDSFEEDEQ